MDSPTSAERRFFEKVADERAYQRKRWTDAGDDTHNGLEWGGLLARYVGRVVENVLAFNADLYERSLVALAAVALAAYEAHDRRAHKSSLEPESFLNTGEVPPEAAP